MRSQRLFRIGETFVQLAQCYTATRVVLDDKKDLIVSNLADLLGSYFRDVAKANSAATATADD
jgi:enamine deaminase RidA (YjgF/YER057c/UK114 family)